MNFFFTLLSLSSSTDAQVMAVMFKEIVPAMVCSVFYCFFDTATEVDFIHDMYAAVNLHPTCDKYSYWTYTQIQHICTSISQAPLPRFFSHAAKKKLGLRMGAR